MNGLLLLGDGKGSFRPQRLSESGLFIPGDAKAMVKMRGTTNEYLLAVSQNRGPLKLFRARAAQRLVTFLPGDRFMYLQLKNGKKRKEELYIGTSFLSQSAAFTSVNSLISKIEIVNAKGERRVIIDY